MKKEQILQRKAFLLNLRLEGLSYRKIAKIADLSPQRVQQLLSPPRAIKKIVQSRAMDMCQSCDMPLNGHGHIHHQACMGMEPDNYGDIENLQYLCPSCHRRAHGPEDPKHQVNTRLSDEARRLLWVLTQKLAVNQTAVIELAIRQLADKEHIPRS